MTTFAAHFTARTFDDLAHNLAEAIEAKLPDPVVLDEGARGRLRNALAAYLLSERIDVETGAPLTICYACDESFRPLTREEAAAALCPEHEDMTEREKDEALRRCEAIRGIRDLPREQVVALLEGAAIQCYDHETDEELREALAVNVKDGTIRADALDGEG